MHVPDAREKWPGKIEQVALGATREQGGTRKSSVVIGGESALPFLPMDGAIPNPPVVAVEIQDSVPDWHQSLAARIGNAAGNPGEWARLAEESGAQILVMRCRGADPAGENRPAAAVAESVAQALKSCSLPLILLGCGSEEKDAQVFSACGEIIKPERGAIGSAESGKYKSIASAAMAYDQGVVAFSNIDVNLAKQLNILLTEFGVKKNRIIMDPLMGALGYGLDYSYSVNERIRIAALQGDSMLQLPIICDAGLAWNTAEATDNENASWGDPARRGVLWEAVTAQAALLSGANIVVMRDFEALGMVKKEISRLLGGV